MNKSTKKPEIHITLVEGLIELDKWLEKEGLYLDLKIIGGSALHLHNIEIDRATTDIDIATAITDKEILDQIARIGRKEGLEETWIEFSDVAIPTEANFESHSLFNPLRNISGKFLDIESLFITKIAAYYDRLHRQITDVDDIESMIKSGETLTTQLIQAGMDFIRKTRKYPLDEDRMTQVQKDLNSLLTSTD